ncbi:sigma-70 RNA polymerase sigma factor region 4 domain-containing protein [Desulfotruncus alcoholivorax]|uniref:sigma-70 family RNA polymerase sigma factor n=1 Tax=Desulfotruncus alcoholivorax TaxID=265477 RepID=UPI0004892B1C|nr:sigma-70 family RNA polymerase sigma factor [Desulfotruncus alcoholivorax]
MPQTGKPLTQRHSPEEILNLLYNTGFRLTGSHRETTDLVLRAFDALTGCEKVNFSTALKGLCSVYIKTAAENLGQSLFRNNCSTGKVQEALLSLPHKERLVVVLREILGLDYTVIANMTGLRKKDVSELLSTGRSYLIKQLLPSTEEPKRVLHS